MSDNAADDPHMVPVAPSDATAAAGMALGAILSLAAPSFPGLAILGAAIGGFMGKTLGKRIEHHHD